MSAMKPIPIAPNTNPRSLQNLYTPNDVALHFGFAISLIAASKVGQTSAVPLPKRHSNDQTGEKILGK